jgi:LmbE family N-acetylglucosaminyl deacetylase
MSGRVLMFVGAHPDDETFGPGGTLARYAAEGVRVVYACATRGEAGSAEPDELGGQRWAELMSAAKALRLAAVLLLGYRDSGMPGWPENRHPRALMLAALEDVTREVVAVIRSERPQVVITFDPIGGYHHPDHIAIHQATVRAFHMAGDPAQYPGVGTPFSPQKLYFWIPPRRILKLRVALLRALGRDPSRAGRNGDVDLASVARMRFPVHARIRLSQAAVGRKLAAVRCHASQIGPPTLTRRLLGPLARLLGRSELYLRAAPVPEPARLEADLFEGLA